MLKANAGVKLRLSSANKKQGIKTKTVKLKVALSKHCGVVRLKINLGSPIQEEHRPKNMGNMRCAAHNKR